MRLSRSRLALRAALLAVGGAYMLWRAWEARRAAGALEGGDAVLGGRVALVWALVGALALLTAGSAALALRRRPPKKTLHLGDVEHGGREPARGRGPPPGPSTPQRQ